MTIRSDEELRGMRDAGRLVAETLAYLEPRVIPGVSTAALDDMARAFLEMRGARSAPQLAYDFPCYICLCVNEEIVHGIGSTRVIQDGDIVTIDVAVELNGYVADAARTIAMPKASMQARRLITSAKRAFRAGVDAAQPGVPVRAIGRAIERSVRRDGFSVIEELCGHGLGRSIHEEPSVPNFDDPRARSRLHEGLVLAIEPLVSMSPTRVVEEADGWTIRTQNRTWSAHHENTVVVMDGAPLILTAA